MTKNIKDKNKINEPFLRFKEFSGKWEEKKLGEIGKFVSGGTPKTTNKEYYDGDIPFIRSGEINSDFTELKISNEGLKNSSAKMIDKGDLLIALYGATSGEIAISKIKGAINQAILCINTQFNKEFIKGIWQKHIDKILKSHLQGGQGNLSAEIVKSLKFYFPTLTEQQKIATFLSKIDERISTQRALIRDLEMYKKGLMQKLFSREIRFPNFSNEWEEKALGEIGETYNGLSGKTKEDFGEGKPYIQYKQVFDNSKIDIQNFDFVNVDENQNKVEFGDVLFTTSSETPEEVGMSSVLLDKIDKDLYLNSFCFGYRANFEILNPFFARYLFRSENFRNEIKKLAQGSTRYNISKVQLMNFKILIPSLEEQNKIASIFSKIDEKIETEQQILENYIAQKRYLLQKMFV